MSTELIRQVITDTVYHVEHSADPDIHRSAEHVDTVLKPHLERIHRLLASDSNELEAALIELETRNEMAAMSLRMLIQEIRATGIDGCLRVCLGEAGFSS